MNDRFLQGLRVLDFTRVLSGPYTTRILADFGAEVIKVQSGKTARGAESNFSRYFQNWNRNKRSITLDMSYPGAREMAMRLVEISDVVVENFSPRVMTNWGMEYDSLKQINPLLIMLSMSGMGRTGPWKDYVSFGPTLQASGGLTYLTSYSEGEPLGMGFSYADVVAGLYGAVAVLAALEFRAASGNGLHIDLSQYEATCTTIGPALMEVLAGGVDYFFGGTGAEAMEAAPYGIYRCSGKERWCVIAVFSDQEWRSLSHVLGDPSWMRMARFSTTLKRKAHTAEIDERLQEWTLGQEAERVVKRLQEAGVHAGVVQNAEDMAQDPHLLQRGFFAELTHPLRGAYLADTYPFRFADHSPGPWESAPLLGDDNLYVYRDLLGLSEQEIRLMTEEGIIA